MVQNHHFALMLRILLCFSSLFMNSYASDQTRPLFLRILEASNEFENEILPKTNDKPISVLTSIFIVSMDNLDLTTMDYQTDFYLYQEWKDSKLVHCSEEDIVLDVKLQSKIWVPDTYIVNSKQSHFHSVILDNKKIQVAKDGLVKLRIRLTARASCPADLHYFPWDVQHCSLVLESYSYSNKDVEFVWADDLMTGQKLLAPNVKALSQYAVTDVSLSRKVSEYAIGNWSTLIITFKLERYSGLYVILVMGPSLIIVCISWVTFLIGHDQHPARVSLGITSILTMEAIQLFIESSLPKVSYMTTLDVYSFVSYAFVLLAMTEYALVLIIVEKGAKEANQEYGLGEQPTAEENLSTNEKKPEVEESQSNPCCGCLLEQKFKIKCSFRRLGLTTAYKIDSFSRMFFPVSFLTFNVGFLGYVCFSITNEHI